MDEDHRQFIMSQFRDVDWAIVSFDYDKTVCESIRVIKDEYDYSHFVDGDEVELLFFNSGDRVPKANTDSKEMEVCRELKIKYVALPLPKIYSSSELLSSLTK